MKICFYNLNLGTKNPGINSIFGGMYKSFWDALKRQNIDVFFSDNYNNLKGDILVVPLGGYQEQNSAKAMNRFNGPVILYVPPAYSWLYVSFLKRWKDRILFAYGTDAAHLSTQKYNELGIPYYHFPFASDNEIFKPLGVPKIYDLLFVGNFNSGVGRYKYIKLLMETAQVKNWEVLLIGTGWEKFGHPFQMIAHGKLLNYAYNSSKICLNIHNDNQYKGHLYQMDANNRVFDLAMAGCFQIGNAKELIELYFTHDEVVAEDDPARLIELIDYYLQNDAQRSQIGKKALAKALNKHTWDSRAQSFVQMITHHLHNYKNKPISPLLRLARKLDQYLYPTYQLKQIRLYKKFFN
jgi:hypothetical protein